MEPAMNSVHFSAQSDFRLAPIRGGRRETELMRFRHRIFREQLRWLAPAEDGLDRDDYDSFSDNFAVLDGNDVIGSARITPGHCPFMIESEFAALMPEGYMLEKGAHSAEVTRFAVGQNDRGQRPEAAAHLLYFSLYAWARAHQVRLMYFVVEPPFFRHIQRLGFPAHRIGPARPLDGGVMSQAAYLDWSEAGSDFIRWLRSAVASPSEVPALSHASGYSHPAFG
jgi:N-acyl-L-homoserine lactone synthetase